MRRENRETRTPRLYIRARFGMFEWYCPKCGKWNLSHVSYRTGYLVRCKGHHRGNIYVLGHTLRPYEIKGRRPPWPPDMVFPPDRQFTPEAWRVGEPVNELLPLRMSGNENDRIEEEGDDNGT